MSLLEYYSVQNTGWSNGTSWFDSGGDRANPLRFKDMKSAIDYIHDKHWGDTAVEWRILHHKLEREYEGKKEIKAYHTVEYVYVDPVIRPEKL